MRILLRSLLGLAVLAALAGPAGAARDSWIALFPSDLEPAVRDAAVPIWGREDGVIVAGPSDSQLDALRVQGVEPVFTARDHGEGIHVLSHDRYFTPPVLAGVPRFRISERSMLYLIPAGLEMELPGRKLHALFHGVPRIPLPPLRVHPADAAPPRVSAAPLALVQQIVDATSQANWLQDVRDLSGDSDVTIPGYCTGCRIRTRASNYMFPPNNAGDPPGNPFATEYLEQKAAEWGFTGPNAVRESYTQASSGCTARQGPQTWQNLVFTLPAQVDFAQSQQVIFLTHYDSIAESAEKDANDAPGADDAMSGGAALLEAMRIFKGYAWRYPVKFLFVSGEETGLCGSTAYTRMHPAAAMWRVLNMDQTAFDGNQDGLMNLFNWNAAECPGCVAFGDAFVQASADYGNILDPAKIVRNPAFLCATDHCPFWLAGVAAIDLDEDITHNDVCPCFDERQTSTCRDTVTQTYPIGGTTLMFDQDYSWPTEKAAIALIAHTAEPLYACPAAGATLTGTADRQAQLSWPAVPPVTQYVVERAKGGCGGAFAGVASTTGSSYTDTAVTAGSYGYRVRTCPFQVSNCVAVVVQSTTTTTTTFTSIAAQDGWVLEASEAANTGGSLNATARAAGALLVGDDGANRQYKAVVSFDTSAIPDGATILSATLRLHRGAVSGTNPFTTHGTCWVDVYTGGFSGSTALQKSDFQAPATVVRAASLSNAATNGAWSEGSLNAAGLAAINKAGVTQLRVYFSLDDDNDRRADSIGYDSGDNRTAAYRPQLMVTYR